MIRNLQPFERVIVVLVKKLNNKCKQQKCIISRRQLGIMTDCYLMYFSEYAERRVRFYLELKHGYSPVLSTEIKSITVEICLFTF